MSDHFVRSSACPKVAGSVRLGSFGTGFRLQQVFQLRALSGDEQFSGGRIHARPPKLVDGSAKLADLGSKTSTQSSNLPGHGRRSSPTTSLVPQHVRA
jgi:hypothetical protein